MQVLASALCYWVFTTSAKGYWGKSDVQIFPRIKEPAVEKLFYSILFVRKKLKGSQLPK